MSRLHEEYTRPASSLIEPVFPATCMGQGQINNKLLAQISYLPLRNENVPGTQGFLDFSLVTAVDEKFLPNVFYHIETIGALMRRKGTQLRRTEYRLVVRTLQHDFPGFKCPDVHRHEGFRPGFYNLQLRFTLGALLRFRVKVNRRLMGK